MDKIKKLYQKYLDSPFRATGFFRGMNKMFSYSERERVLKLCFEFVHTNKIYGDYLEFGVFEGKSFIRAYNFAEAYNPSRGMKFYAFDSFEGLPEIKGKDKQVEMFYRGEFSCNVNKFKKILQEKEINLNKVRIIVGWFDKVLNLELKKRLPLKKASIIFVDVDFYESCVPVMNWITDYVQDGTVIIFDDYFCYRGSPELGVRKAFEDWLNKNKNITATPYFQYDWEGKAFILHKKNGNLLIRNN